MYELLSFQAFNETCCCSTSDDCKMITLQLKIELLQSLIEPTDVHIEQLAVTVLLHGIKNPARI